jgi:hypothetical protein
VTLDVQQPGVESVIVSAAVASADSSSFATCSVAIAYSMAAAAVSFCRE